MVLTLDHYNNIVFSQKGEVVGDMNGNLRRLKRYIERIFWRSCQMFSPHPNSLFTSSSSDSIDIPASDRQPIHITTLDESMCYLLSRTLNGVSNHEGWVVDYIQSKPVSLEDNFFSMYPKRPLCE